MITKPTHAHFTCAMEAATKNIVPLALYKPNCCDHEEYVSMTFPSLEDVRSWNNISSNNKNVVAAEHFILYGHSTEDT